MSSWKDDGDEEEEEEDFENDYKTAEDRIIFLIDVRSYMFEKNKLNEVHFNNCIKVVLAVMKTKIVASDKSSVGVIFFGTVRKNVCMKIKVLA
jgi:Ku70/Ku80 N-terminal alpha/beta domain